MSMYAYICKYVCIITLFLHGLCLSREENVGMLNVEESPVLRAEVDSMEGG